MDVPYYGIPFIVYIARSAVVDAELLVDGDLRIGGAVCFHRADIDRHFVSLEVAGAIAKDLRVYRRAVDTGIRATGLVKI